MSNYLSIPLEEAMRTQRALRRLKDDPVPADLLMHLLDLAIRAPSGSNRQNWDFVVVQDRALVAEFGRLNGQPVKLARWLGLLRADDPGRARMVASFAHQAENFHRIPVLVVACLRGWIWPFPFLALTSAFGSIYPAVQNLLLAARGAGLGAALLTLPVWNTWKVRRLLGLPWSVTPCAVIPLGWPEESYGPNRRLPVQEAVHFDRYGNRRPLS